MRMKILIAVLASICLIYSFSTLGANMFGWFKKQPVQLSSEVRGQILDNGKPVIGQIVSRELIYIDEKVHFDQTITDDKGFFYFPEKIIMSSIPSKPLVEHRISQAIFIDKKNRNYQDLQHKKNLNSDHDFYRLWNTTKPSYKNISAFTEKLSFLQCNIKNKKVSFEFGFDNGYYSYRGSSICRWENDFLMTMLYDNGKTYIVHDNDINKLEELIR